MLHYVVVLAITCVFIVDCSYQDCSYYDHNHYLHSYCSGGFCMHSGILPTDGRSNIRGSTRPQTPKKTLHFFFVYHTAENQNPLARPMNFEQCQKTAQSTELCFRAFRFSCRRFRLDCLQKSDARHRFSQTPLMSTICRTFSQIASPTSCV